MRVIYFLVILTALMSCNTDPSSNKDTALKEKIDALNKSEDRNFVQDPNLPNAIEFIAANEALNVCIEALMGAELIEELQGSGPFTVFAATDSAFLELGEDYLDEIMRWENKEELRKLMSAHVVRGIWKTLDLNSELLSMEGTTINIAKKGSDILINNCKILSSDIDVANGVVHIIENVMQDSEHDNASLLN